ncbi:MAG: carboxypeptidase-like regulatory domain-containing protein [Acidobacteria bacterium]|nr:carboxypeptidase-like regulatory domain-containing protein [Acidobacteriota bacterium]
MSLLSVFVRALGAIAAALVFAVLVAVAGAPGSGVLRGTVKDADGKPVEGAVVMAMLEDSEQAPRAVGTDALGVYRVSGLAPGTYRVGVRKAGFVSREFGAVTVGAEGATLDVALQKPQPLAAIGPASGAPGAGGGVARAGGRSISITSAPKEDAAKQETAVLRATYVDDLALMEFLNQQAKDGREVVQVLPLEAGDSLFVTVSLGERPKPSYLVLPVYEPIEEGRIKDRLGLQKGRTLLGLHRLSGESYALIFR